MANDRNQDESDPQQMSLWGTDSDATTPSLQKKVAPGALTRQPPGPTSAECLWDITAVSSFLGVPVATIYQWRVKGEGPPATRMGKHLRYEPALVRAWVSEHRESA